MKSLTLQGVFALAFLAPTKRVLSFTFKLKNIGHLMTGTEPLNEKAVPHTKKP